MNNKKYHVIAYHGWGFDASIWNSLKTEFEPHCKFEAADRGYFSDSYQPTWDNDSDSELKKLLIVHSYGLHWCDEKILRQADQLVLISSFLNFHPVDPTEQKRSKMILRRMQAQFVDAPETVLDKFYDEVFLPVKSLMDVPSELNHDLLLADLGDLDHDNRENAEVFNRHSITIIHGAKDQIVDNKLAREMYTKLRLRSQYFEIKHGGHGLPVTHADKIFEILNSLLHIK